MRLFELKTRIYRFVSFDDFVQYFQLSKDDLLISNKSVFINYIDNLKLPSDSIFPSDYEQHKITDLVVDKILKDINKKHYKRIFAVGEDTVINIGKIAALSNITHSKDILDSDRDFSKDKTLVLIPTTCGIGNEVTCCASIQIAKSHTKCQTCFDSLYGDYAVLIPELLKDLPFDAFISSSMDSLIHAAEIFISPASNSYTDLYSQNAIETILTGYIKLIEKGIDYYPNLLEEYQTASNYTGIASAITGNSTIDALSYMLSGKYNIPNGYANYTFFIEVFKKYTRENPYGKIKYFNNIVSDIFNIKNDSNLYDEFQDALMEIIEKKPGSGYGMTYSDIEAFSKSIVDRQHNLLSNSYVPLSYKDILDIYKNIY
ncbi:iron-containing alcohol dehydrogenase [Clostridium oryzae]|uniref:Aldehyde-alcohol dehydrogenase n=1 Tax=Clostridium oryzae TaxID=1450648 RepID=A0A1V4IWY8_9CLOT|nr:iron-containing alcohol dehydrogenase [Clostridium oryzae]OPJ64572.1 aldehyde-alcohol dehydrogenase [Clostridium oryzae]